MKFIGSTIAFNDTIDSLKYEFRNDTSNNIIVCGAKDFAKQFDISVLKQKFDKVIVFNQEQLGATQCNFLTPEYKHWIANADEVWDYDEANFMYLQELTNNLKLHSLQSYKDWSIYEPVEKDIDILFYGSINDHRAKLLNELAKRHKVCVLTFEWNKLDNYIMRSKILLNIHYYYECALQEQARIIRWIGAPCRIVSEKSHKNYLNVEEFNYEDLMKI